MPAAADQQLAPSPAIDFRAVSFAYPGGRAALRTITMRVDQGMLLGIIGPNGGGKSTLLKLALGLLRPDAGEVRVHGLDPVEARGRGLIATVPQDVEADLSFPVSVRQVVAMGWSWRTPFWKRTPRDSALRVERAMEMCGVAGLADSPIGALSGGQRQRAFIARAIAGEARILLLDEPLASIDESGRRRFSEMLGRVHRELGLTVLVVTHDLRSIGAIAGGEGVGEGGTDAQTRCDRIACLRTSLHFHAAPEGITPALLAQVFEHDLSDVFGRVHVDAHPHAECGHLHPHAPHHAASRPPSHPPSHAHDAPQAQARVNIGPERRPPEPPR